MKIPAMKTLTFIALLALTPFSAHSAGGQGPELEPVEVKLHDTRSLQSGAKIFVNYCLSCHSAEYMRYNRLSSDLDIPAELVQSEMIFSDAKIGDLMTTTMPRDKAEEWFGVAPPDLTLSARLRGPDWLYNYFKSFYVDESTVSGWNNTVFPNVAMPHVLSQWQGRQRAVFGEGEDGKPVFEGFDLETEGSMTPEEFDHAMRDLTNYMVYMAEPAKLKRVQYGIWVILFLLVFAGFAYLLKKEYWRDVDVSH